MPFWDNTLIYSHISIFKSKQSLGSQSRTLTKIKVHLVVFNVCSGVRKLLDHCCKGWIWLYACIHWFFFPITLKKVFYITFLLSNAARKYYNVSLIIHILINSPKFLGLLFDHQDNVTVPVDLSLSKLLIVSYPWGLCFIPNIVPIVTEILKFLC